MRAKLALTGMLFLGLIGCASVAPPSTDMPAAVATAINPGDHQKIADYYASKALAYDAEAAQHDRIGRSYVNRTRGDSTAMLSHCRALRDQFIAAAKEARALAQEHQQVAAKGGN